MKAIKPNGDIIEGTPEEFKKLYNNGDDMEMTLDDLKPVNIVKITRGKYKTRNSRKNKSWTVKEIETLKEMVLYKKPNKYIAREMKRTLHGIRAKIQKLKIKGSNHPKINHWTQTEHETMVKEHKNGNSIKRIAKLIGRTEKAVACRLSMVKQNKLKSDTIGIGRDTRIAKKFSIMG